MAKRIAFVGDIALDKSALKFDKAHNYEYLIGNLEGPLLDNFSYFDAATKAGPHLFNALSSLPEQEIDFGKWIFSLSNNHTMDFGLEGLVRTIQLIEDRKGNYLGAGLDKEQSRKSIIFTLGKIKIALIACTEKTFRNSSVSVAGVAEVGEWVASQIVENSIRGITSVVLFHGGTEDFALPSPSNVSRYRSWIDLGASLVIGTHPHIVLPWEEYGNGAIYYGLGNFAVEPQRWVSKDGRNTRSLVVELEDVGGELSISHRFFNCSNSIGDSTCVVTAEDNGTSNEFVESLGALIANSGLHEAVWQEFAVHMYGNFFRRQIRIASLFETIASTLSQKALRRLPLLNKPFFFDLIAWADNRNIIETAQGIRSGHIVDLRNATSNAIWAKILQGQPVNALV